MSYLLFVSGALCIFCSIMDYDWFMNHRKAKFFVNIFGRIGTRIFYIILGAVVMFLSLMMSITPP